MKKKIEKKHLITIMICTSIFIIALFFLFFAQHNKLSGQFDSLITDNLSAYTHGLRRQAHGIIIDVKKTLSGIASVIEETDVSPDNHWLALYTQELGGENPMINFDYVTARQIEERRASGVSSESNKNIYDQLLNGETVVSQIQKFTGEEEKYVFTLATPVKKGGVITGAVCARVDAAMLFLSVQQSSLFEKSMSLLITQDGEIAYSDSDHYETNGNLFESMGLNGVNAEEIAFFQKEVQNGNHVNYHFENNKKTYYAAADKLDYNNWYIVKFVRSPDVLLQSAAILNSVAVTGILLVVLTAGMIIIAAVLLLRQKKRLDLEAKRYSLLSQFSDTLLFEYDCETDTLQFTSNAKEVLHLERLRMEGISKPGWRPDIIYPDDRGIFDEMFLSALNGGQDNAGGYSECRLKTAEGAYKLFGCHYKVLFGENQPRILIGKLVDITQQWTKEQDLVEKTRKDTLTGLYNKAGEEIIRQLMEETQRGYFYMIDLDSFKAVNDTYGHSVGDQLLSRIGAVLQEIFSDAGCVAARVGGDEFVAFISGDISREAAAEKADEVVTSLIKIELDEAPQLKVSASVGIAAFPADGGDYPSLYNAADRAMYFVKRDSKGSFAFYQSLERQE